MEHGSRTIVSGCLRALLDRSPRTSPRPRHNRDAAGIRPRLHRPPFGELTWADPVRRPQPGLDTWLWSRRVTTGAGAPVLARFAAELIGDGLRTGEVLLLHDADRYAARDCRQATLGGLRQVLEGASQAGRPAVTLRPGLHEASVTPAASQPPEQRA